MTTVPVLAVPVESTTVTVSVVVNPPALCPSTGAVYLPVDETLAPGTAPAAEKL
jgi:hypothetical protein